MSGKPRGVDALGIGPGEWLRGTGPESDIVISTRIRLARNLDGYPFLGRADEKVQAELESKLREAIRKGKVVRKPLYLDLNGTSEVDRMLLVERHLISRDLAGGHGARGVVVNATESVSLMINEEDHLRLQMLQSGFNLRRAWERINKIDDQIEGQVTYCYSPRLGYLTACPTNVGTGMRVSVMLHLPALVLTKEIEKVFYAVSKINLAVRGFYGEGSQTQSDFFQISNQVTLGKSEGEIIDNSEHVILRIIEYERQARKALVRDNRARLEDRIWRAYGILQNARVISSEETMENLSALRLGVNLGMVSGIDIKRVNDLFILTLPAHLQKMHKRELDPETRDRTRAEFIRTQLANGGEG